MRINKYYILYFLLLLVVLMGVLGGVFYLNKYFKTDNEPLNPIGGERDDRGCLVAAGYSWCEESQMCLRTWEEPCTKQDRANNINNIIANIERETLVKFEIVGESKFEWIYKNNFGSMEKLLINGYEFLAEEVELNTQVAVDNYFLNSEFQISPENDKGYVRNGIFCLVKNTTKDDYLDINIKCGYSDGGEYEAIYDDRAENEITNLLAEKYNYEADKVIIEFSEKNTTHARGIVTFLPESPGNSGLFLAMKIDNTWRLVFDGNGSYSCEKIAPYNFPAEMIRDCR